MTPRPTPFFFFSRLCAKLLKVAKHHLSPFNGILICCVYFFFSPLSSTPATFQILLICLATQILPSSWGSHGKLAGGKGGPLHPPQKALSPSEAVFLKSKERINADGEPALVSNVFNR